MRPMPASSPRPSNSSVTWARPLWRSSSRSKRGRPASSLILTAATSCSLPTWAWTYPKSKSHSLTHPFKRPFPPPPTYPPTHPPTPTRECWIKVGGQKQEWANGKAIAFDTHYFHETANTSDKVSRGKRERVYSLTQPSIHVPNHLSTTFLLLHPPTHLPTHSTKQDRYVLLMRFWHPGVTPKEREALQYVFDALDGPDTQVPTYLPPPPPRGEQQSLVYSSPPPPFFPQTHRYPAAHSNRLFFLNPPTHLPLPTKQTDMDFNYLNGLAEAQLQSRRVSEIDEDE